MVGLTKVTGTYTGVQDVDLKVYDTTDNTLDTTKPGIIAVFDEDLYIIGAVVVGEDNSSSNSYIYVLDSAKNEFIDGDYTYWEMDAVVDGEIKTVTVKDKYGNMKADINAITGESHPGEDCLLKVTYDKDGYVVDIEQAPSPDANSDVWYTAADYTVDIEDGPAGAAGSEFKVYSVEYAHTSTDDKPGPAEFYRVGRTLYNRTATDDGNFDAGLTLGSGGSVIVVQNEVSNTGKISRVWESFSDLQSAIDYLADADTFEGYVSAVLNDNGSAKYIVFNGKANVDVTDDDGSGSDGTHVREYPRGTLDVTSTDKLDALDVADAIRAFLNDSRIEDVDYNARNNEATITYTNNRTVTYDVAVKDGVASSELEGAEELGKVIKNVAPNGKAQSGSAVKVEGNEVTTMPDDPTNYYQATGGASHAPATIDLAYLLKGLHDNGAKSIEFNNKTYIWSETKGLKTSSWCEEQANGTPNDSNTLVAAITTAMTNDIGTPSAGQHVSVTASIIVDGAEINITIEFDVPTS